MGAPDAGPKALIFDVDGVILNWCSGFLNWMAGQGHSVAARVPTSYDMANCLPELPRAQLLCWIELFNRHPAYSKLTYLPDAQLEIWRLCKVDFQLWRAAVVSATGTGFWTVKRRADALAKIGCFDDLHCIGVRDPKADFFVRYPAGSIVFEDSTEHALAALELGQRVVFFDYPYNRDCPDDRDGLKKVRSWPAARCAARQLALAP